MLQELVLKAKIGEQDALLTIIEKFKPINMKYAIKLNYEDSYDDLILYEIELINKIKLEQFKQINDAVIVSYITKCIHNHYVYLLKKLIHNKNEICISGLSEEQKYYYEVSIATNDCDNAFKELNIYKILNKEEYNLIYAIYVLGYTSSELARRSNTSRQAINQRKKRILNRIEKMIRK